MAVDDGTFSADNGGERSQSRSENNFNTKSYDIIPWDRKNCFKEEIGGRSPK
jgi:hypothetical protein